MTFVGPVPRNTVTVFVMLGLVQPSHSPVALPTGQVSSRCAGGILQLATERAEREAPTSQVDRGFARSPSAGEREKKKKKKKEKSQF